MPLTNVYVQFLGQLGEVFKALQDAEAPERFTHEFLKDLGFASSNHRALIPVLKALGFLTNEGAPTERYQRFRDRSQARNAMAEGLREAYADIFRIKARPTDADKDLVEGKFKSTHNINDRLAKLMAATFFALLPFADLEASAPTAPISAPIGAEVDEKPKPDASGSTSPRREESKLPESTLNNTKGFGGLHYNIEIHLPATKDVEVYHSIFRALREHFLD